MTVLQDDLIYEILSVVSEIPEGRVASYGQIARLIGRDNNARLVGKVLSMADIPATGLSIVPADWHLLFHHKGSFWKKRALHLRKMAVWI